MSTEPEVFSTELQTETASDRIPLLAPPRPRTIPNFGHMALFLATAGVSILVVQLFAIVAAGQMHLFPHESITEIAQDPRMVLPTMFLSYFVIGILSVVIFTALWRLPFAEGVRWDTAPVVRRRWLLLATGVALSIVVQLLSNFLPIPKELPIDKFFKTPLDVWLIAFFGVFIAPVFEELAFRGFILPALANTWDYLDARYHNRLKSHLQATHFEQDGEHLPGLAQFEPDAPITSYAPRTDPAWSLPALVFASTVTSICFALLHADQLAHAYAPLGVLFCVSLALCVVRLRFHSLAASATVHACYNGTIFALLFVATGGFRHLEKLHK